MRFGWKGLIVAIALVAVVGGTTIAFATRHSSKPSALGSGGSPVPTSPAPSTTVPPAASPAPSPSETEGNGSREQSAELEARDVGSVGTVLVNQKGLTLYHLPTESGTMIQCTGSCATIWPPLLATGGKVPPADPALHGLGTVKRPDGSVQVTYKGMPLYTYVGDTAPGQANGQGIEGFVAVKF